jgi:hypothetical protein
MSVDHYHPLKDKPVFNLRFFSFPFHIKSLFLHLIFIHFAKITWNAHTGKI